MILGMTRAELGLTAFIFALIYGAGFLPGLGRFLGRLGARPGTPPADPPASESEPEPSTNLPETREPR